MILTASGITTQASRESRFAPIVIAPSRGWIALRLGDVWRYHELLLFLVWRDVKVRYKQTVLGIGWAVLQPVATMLVFSVFFGRLAKMPSDGVPYPLFVYCALLPWQLFSHSLNDASNSLVANERLITKVYFPRLIIPLASVVAGIIDFGVASIVFVALLWYFGGHVTGAVLAAPLFVLMTVAAAFAVGLWLSALNVRYRDVRYTVPFLTQFWMFITPVAYPASLVPGRWQPVYALNPLTGVIEGFRWALLGTGGFPGGMLAVSGTVIVLLGFTGIIYFRRMERMFADIV